MSPQHSTSTFQKVILALCLLSRKANGQNSIALTASKINNDDILTNIYSRRFAAFIATDEEYQNPEGTIYMLIVPGFFLPHFSKILTRTSNLKQHVTQLATGMQCGRFQIMLKNGTQSTTSSTLTPKSSKQRLRMTNLWRHRLTIRPIILTIHLHTIPTITIHWG